MKCSFYSSILGPYSTEIETRYRGIKQTLYSYRSKTNQLFVVFLFIGSLFHLGFTVQGGEEEGEKEVFLQKSHQ